MNRKQVVASDWVPPYLHEVRVNGHRLRKGMLVSVNARPGLIGGRWVFTYAEPMGDELVLHVEGPVTRRCRAHPDCDGHPRHKMIRPDDIKIVHVKEARR